jgi:hypothetical protein
MIGTGTPIELTESQMADARVRIDLREAPDFGTFTSQLNNTRSCVPIENMRMQLWAGEPITLYRFIGRFRGQVCGCSQDNWQFDGTVEFEDTFDFDPRPWNFPNTRAFDPNGRTPAAEAQTRFANSAIPGRPFPITSVAAPILQSSKDSEANWSGSGRGPRDIGPN